MKITKRQLKRIIREEYSKLQKKGLVSEYGYGHSEDAMAQDMADQAYHAEFKRCEEKGMDKDACHAAAMEVYAKIYRSY